VALSAERRHFSHGPRASCLVSVAHREDRLRSSFCRGDDAALRLSNDCRFPLATLGERKYRQALYIVESDFGPPDLAQDRRIQRVSAVATGRESDDAQESGIVHIGIWAQMCQAKLPFGDGAGLVGAHGRNAADVLHGDSPPHERLPSSQPIDADAEEEREDDGEFLRQGRDGERHRAHEGVEPAVTLSQPHRREDETDDRGNAEQQAHEVLDGELKGCECTLALHRRPDNFPVHGLRAREYNPHERFSRQQARPREYPVEGLDRRFVAPHDSLP